jgi:hypothetical protein
MLTCPSTASIGAVGTPDQNAQPVTVAGRMVTMRKGIRAAAIGSIVLFALSLLWSPEIMGYPNYDGGSSPACKSCHGGFGGPGAARHDAHNQMTSNCTICHVVTGDNPSTSSSGADSNHGCNGCHSGPGLRAHHINAGAPADANSRTCTSLCHGSDPTPPGETVLPAYYTRGDVNLTAPCLTDPAQGGEDYIGSDGQGLDNDGNLLYEAADPDCQSIQVLDQTWGAVKAVYR